MWGGYTEDFSKGKKLATTSTVVLMVSCSCGEDTLKTSVRERS